MTFLGDDTFKQCIMGLIRSFVVREITPVHIFKKKFKKSNANALTSATDNNELFRVQAEALAN
jgi:hypothetical protein